MIEMWLHGFFGLLMLSPALFTYLFTYRFQRAAGFPTSREPSLLSTVQHETCYLPIHHVVRMFPSCITHVECTAFLLIVIQEKSLLTILVLEVTAIHTGKGLLVSQMAPQRFNTLPDEFLQSLFFRIVPLFFVIVIVYGFLMIIEVGLLEDLRHQGFIDRGCAKNIILLCKAIGRLFYRE